MNAGAPGTAGANYRIPPSLDRNEAAEALDRLATAVLDLAATHDNCCQHVHVDRLRAAVAEALEVR